MYLRVSMVHGIWSPQQLWNKYLNHSKIPLYNVQGNFHWMCGCISVNKVLTQALADLWNLRDRKITIGEIVELVVPHEFDILLLYHA
jgi:hypothetical protein